MKNAIFYQPLFIDSATDKDSGTLVRPYAIKRAFIQYGYSIIDINGSTRSRKKEIKKALKNSKDIDFMYIESANIPFCLSNHNHWPISFADFKNILEVKKYMKVGIFYRDAYWRYQSFCAEVGLVKSTILKILYYFELVFLKKQVDYIFVPTLAFGNFLPKIKGNAKYIPLPAGCDKDVNNLFVQPEKGNLNILFSGNLSHAEYCITGLFNVMDKVKKYGIKLTLNTNKKAYDNCIDSWPLLKALQTDSTIDVIYSSYNETSQLVKKYSLAIIYNNIDSNIRNIYMPIKLFYYISMGLPIIAEGNSGYGDFIETNKIGWTYSNDEDLEKLLVKLNSEPREIIDVVERVNKVREENTWEVRVRTIESYLK